MKIGDEELKSIYQAYLKSRNPTSRSGCPSFDDILDLIDREPSKRRKEGLIVHLSQCAPCAEEFDFLREIRKQESLLAHEIERLSRERTAKPRSKVSLFGMRFVWRYAPILIGICLVFGIYQLARYFSPGADFTGIGQRGAQTASIKLIKPKRMSTPPYLWVFRWEDAIDAEAYWLEIFDEGLFPIINVPGIKVREFRLPEPLAKKIPSTGRWSWMVTVQTRNGVRVSSPLQPFSMGD